jgi:hypothetical protein
MESKVIIVVSCNYICLQVACDNVFMYINSQKSQKILWNWYYYFSHLIAKESKTEKRKPLAKIPASVTKSAMT